MDDVPFDIAELRIILDSCEPNDTAPLRLSSRALASFRELLEKKERERDIDDQVRRAQGLPKKKGDYMPSKPSDFPITSPASWTLHTAQAEYVACLDTDITFARWGEFWIWWDRHEVFVGRDGAIFGKAACTPGQSWQKVATSIIEDAGYGNAPRSGGGR